MRQKENSGDDKDEENEEPNRSDDGGPGGNGSNGGDDPGASGWPRRPFSRPCGPDLT